MKKYKIEFNSLEHKDNFDLEIKSLLRNKWNGNYSKILIFLNFYPCLSSSEILDLMVQNYRKHIDKSNLNRSLKNLLNLQLITYNIPNNNSNLNDEKFKLLNQKHKEFLLDVPKQFRSQFDKLKYYSITEKGNEFIPFCCEVNGFKCKEEK